MGRVLKEPDIIQKEDDYDGKRPTHKIQKELLAAVKVDFFSYA